MTSLFTCTEEPSSGTGRWKHVVQAALVDLRFLCVQALQHSLRARLPRFRRFFRLRSQDTNASAQHPAGCILQRSRRRLKLQQGRPSVPQGRQRDLLQQLRVTTANPLRGLHPRRAVARYRQIYLVSRCSRAARISLWRCSATLLPEVAWDGLKGVASR